MTEKNDPFKNMTSNEIARALMLRKLEEEMETVIEAWVKAVFVGEAITSEFAKDQTVAPPLTWKITTTESAIGHVQQLLTEIIGKVSATDFVAKMDEAVKKVARGDRKDALQYLEVINTVTKLMNQRVSGGSDLPRQTHNPTGGLGGLFSQSPLNTNKKDGKKNL